MISTPRIKIFHYDAESDYFTVTEEYKALAETLGLIEWNPVVWIGRLFCMDNDFGEHWFDNWEELERRGLDESYRLFVIDPSRFQDGEDGPCHSDEQRKRFWADVLCSLELSLETLFEEARMNNREAGEDEDCGYVRNLEDKIARIAADYAGREGIQ